MDAQKKTLRASEQAEAARDAWRAEVAPIPAGPLVCLDETGSHLGYTPTHAWAPRGQRAHAAAPRNPGENKTVIAALTRDGIGALMRFDGGMTGARFEGYVRHVLAPTLRPGQVVIADNLRAHHTDGARAAIEARGARLLRLLTVPPERHGFLLYWSRWRRAHQAVARRGHIAARARAQPAARDSAPIEAAPAPVDRPLPPELTDAAWARVQPLLPPRAPVGRPPRDSRLVLDGVLWVLRAHASWRALPARYGPWRTVYGRHRLWVRTGLWPRILDALNDTTTPTPQVSL